MAKHSRGAKQAFVAMHLDKSNAEIVAAAAGSELDLSTQRVQTIRWKLKQKGIVKPSLALPTGSAPRPAPRAQLKPKSKQPAASPKVLLLRRLIFEIGYDEARAVFEGFEYIYERIDAP